MLELTAWTLGIAGIAASIALVGAAVWALATGYEVTSSADNLPRTSLPYACPECGSLKTRDTGMGSGVMTSTYAKLTFRYECEACGHWFTKTIEYDKTQANDRSKAALRQMRRGEMNTYRSVDDLIRHLK